MLEIPAEMHAGLLFSVYFFLILIMIEKCQESLVKLSNAKFNENSFSILQLLHM
jgi:hypothetical protein